MLDSEQKAGKLYKHFLGVGETRVTRDFFEEAIKSALVVQPHQLWTYSDHIPNGDDISGGQDAVAEIRGLNAGNPIFYWNKSESEAIPIVKKLIGVTFTKIDDGTDKSFLLADEDGNPIKNIIPFNYYSDLYNYELTTAGGDPIYFGVGDWVLDVYSGILTFYGTVPSGVDHNNPPVISCYQYVGGNGFRQDTYGFDGAILPLKNQKFPIDGCVLGNLDSIITETANEIEPNFVQTYGWDGADKNEGVAFKFETIIPVTYAGSKDVVKGYDRSRESEVVSLLSRRAAHFNGSTPPDIDIIFENENMPNGEHSLSVSSGYLALDSGDPIEYTIGVPIKVSNEENFVVVKMNGSVADGDYSFTVGTGSSSAILLYWDIESKEYLPFVNKEDVEYDFGFPVVAINGKFPPHLMLNSITLGSYSDNITPDYYGPRTHSIVIAAADGKDTKSADYIVRNTAGFFLNDILNAIASEYSDGSFVGTIYLRAGRYLMNGSADLSGMGRVVLMGEGSESVFVSASESDVTLQYNHTDGDNIGFFGIKGISFDDVELFFESETDGFILSDFISNTVVNASHKDAMARIAYSSIDTLNFVSTVAVDNLHKDSIYQSFVDTVIGEVNIAGNQGIIRGCSVGQLTIDGSNWFVKGCCISSCEKKSKDIFIDSSTVLGYASDIDRGQIPDEFKFPFYTSPIYKRYVSFDEPIYYDDSSDKIKIDLDGEVLEIDEDGKLTTCINASRIVLNPSDYVRPSSSGLTVTATTLKAALKDIYGTKADLVGGKVPLQQLPDSVAYGGLLFVGTWQFEDSNGDYPKFADAKRQYSLDEEVDKLQPGWFFVIADSNEENNPAKPQSSDKQKYTSKEVVDGIETETEVEVSGEIYTAGDWLIWNGLFFEKLDRAYQDGVYAILPVKCPDNLEWLWTRGGHGSIDLGGKTIWQSFDDVNVELKKLAVQKPIGVSKVDLVPIDGLSKVEYRKVVGGASPYIEPTIKESYLSIGNSFHIEFTNRDLKKNAWEYAVYFGEKATLELYQHTETKDFLLESVDLSSDMAAYSGAYMTVSKPYDPYGKNYVGRDYWLGVDIGLRFDFPVGENSIYLKVSDIEPVVAENNVLNGVSAKTTWLSVKPFDFDGTHTQGMTLANIGEFEHRQSLDAVSGVMKISLGTPFVFNLSFTVANACKSEIGTDKFIEVVCDYDNVAYPVENPVMEQGAADGWFNARCQVSIPMPSVDSIFDGLIKFKVRVYNILGDMTELTVLSFVTRFDNTKEDERVQSGIEIYPVYDPEVVGNCGHAYSHTTALDDTNSIAYLKELMKLGENVYNDDGEVVGQIGKYQWPKGLHQFGTSNNGENNDHYVNYDKVEGQGIDTGLMVTEVKDSGLYRFATFTKFDGNICELSNASGVAFELADGEGFVQNAYDARTENTIVQVKLVDKNTYDSITGWLDANKAYDGFSSPLNDGDAAMYAGTSTATLKRVTFGKNVRSGMLIVRVGLRSDNKAKFSCVRIKEVI